MLVALMGVVDRPCRSLSCYCWVLILLSFFMFLQLNFATLLLMSVITTFLLQSFATLLSLATLLPLVSYCVEMLQHHHNFTSKRRKGANLSTQQIWQDLLSKWNKCWTWGHTYKHSEQTDNFSATILDHEWTCEKFH